jgi:predicted transcriptional regulator
MTERKWPKPGEAFAPLAVGRELFDAIEAAVNLCDSDKRLWRLLARVAGNKTWCRVTADWLAKTLGKSRRAVFYGLDRLAKRGMIARSRQGCRGMVLRFLWSPEYQHLQQLNSGIVQEVALFESREGGIVQLLHSNSATGCTEIVQPAAHIPGIPGIPTTHIGARQVETQPVQSDGFDGSQSFKRIWDRHPRKTGRYLAEQAFAQALAEALNPAALAAEIERVHEAWCACEDWRKQGGRYAPELHRWLRERRWLDGPPQAPEEERIIPYRPPWELEETESNA